MQTERKPMRYAHAEGHTDVCYSEDGKYILTCGSDGDVRIWAGIEDDDPSTECAGEVALAVKLRDNRFYVGTDNNNVQAYTFPEVKRDGIIARFTAPVSDIVLSEDGTRLIAGGCDMEIQVVTIQTNEIVKLIGHSAPILSVSADPKNKYVASSSCDGSIRIWDVEPACVIKKYANVIPSCNDFFKSTVLGRSTWQPKSGLLFAFPLEKEVQVYERETWVLKFSLNETSIKKELSIAAFSPCGKYIAASSITGEIIIWHVSRRSTISYTAHPKNVRITSMVWLPKGDELIFADGLGQLGSVSINLSDEAFKERISDEIVKSDDNKFEQPEEDDDDDDDDENAISLDKIKASSGWLSPSKMDETSRSSLADDDAESKRSEVIRNVMPLTETQPAFQPSATPSHFQHRYMVWNSVGIVRCFNTEDEKSIDVEFHDTMFHHGLHKNNHEDFTMAALSTKVLALASSSNDECPSKLTCILLNSWDGSKEWSSTLTEGEEIVAIAAAGNWVAVATDTFNLRLFSHAGTQRQVVSLPGPIVCLSGHGSELMVIFHAGLGLPESQNLSFTIYDVSGFLIRCSVPIQPLPLSPKSTLKWAGFTDEGTACAYDANGILRGFLSEDLHWNILCDTKTHCKGKSDHYFILGVSEKYQNIRGILCKGSFYPMTTPRPTVVEISMKIPLLEMETEKSINEEKFWRNILCYSNVKELSKTESDYQMSLLEIEKALKQAIIKLFANACRGDADMRATEVATLMSEQPLQIAVKYASKFGKMYLAEKLTKISPVDWNSLRQFKNKIENCENGNDESFGKDGIGFTSQRDMFEESQQTQEENKLLAADNKRRETFDSVDTVITPRSKNPFKISKKNEDGHKGLNFFDSYKPTVENKNNRLPSTSDVNRKVSKQKISSESTSKKKTTFVQWFALNKASLTEEFPELSINELTKVGMKRFREENQSQNNSAIVTENSQDKKDSSELQTTMNDEDTKKRKLDDSFEESQNKKSVASKLSAFSFQKR